MGDWLDGYFENRAIINRLDTTIVSATDFGAAGDSITDDTAAIQAAIDYVQSLTADRFKGSHAVFLPSGTYKITSTLTINESGVSLIGDSTGSSILYAPSSDFDMVHFDGTALTLYQAGAMNLRFYSPTNATAGCQLKVQKVIHGKFLNLHFMGWYDGLISDGCGKTYYDNITFSQENRTAGNPRYAMDFKSTSNNNSDVHVSNYQVTYDTETSDYTVSIRGSDGIYFTNGHQHGALLIQPSGSVVCSSVFWSNVYFDTSLVQNVVFSGGTSGAYRNFWFNNCYFRDSGSNGLAIESTSIVSRVLINNCIFSDHQQYGIYTNSDIDLVTVSNCIFSGNNIVNTSGTSDIRSYGEMLISNNYFSGGGANGNAVSLHTTSNNCIVEGNSFVNSTAGTKISNGGTDNKIRGNAGYVQKASGQATITNPATTVVVNHGLVVTPGIAQIRLTFNDIATGVTRVYPSTITSTQFTINANATPTTSAVIGWGIDTET